MVIVLPTARFAVLHVMVPPDPGVGRRKSLAANWRWRGRPDDSVVRLLSVPFAETKTFCL
jgi:hypothetical protein